MKHGSYLAKNIILFFLLLGFMHFPIKMSAFNPYQVECYHRQWILVIAKRDSCFNFSEKVLKICRYFLKSRCLFCFLVHIDVKRTRLSFHGCSCWLWSLRVWKETKGLSLLFPHRLPAHILVYTSWMNIVSLLVPLYCRDNTTPK